MTTLFRFVALVALTAALATPLSASAQLSFGGRIISWHHCSNLGGGIRFDLIPAMPSAYTTGLLTTTYIWTPLTRNNMFSPTPAAPPIPGYKVLGVASPFPVLCIGFGTNPFRVYGFPIIYMGQSLLP